MRVDKIESIKDLCTGCMACVDACPQKCVSKYVDVDGFIYTKVDSSRCIDCGKCVSVCPVFKLNKNTSRQSLFAAYAKDKYVHNRGSSGGIFEVIATYALDNGYYVCGAGFDGTQVKHKIVKNKNDLSILLKSKYVQSDTKPIANLIGSEYCVEKIENLATRYDYEDSKYVGMITWTSYGFGERMLKKEFEQSPEVEFEGYKFPAVACWNKYLTNIYGDYMQLPPVEARKTHNMIAYKVIEDLNNL